jgi:hypothetical protein
VFWDCCSWCSCGGVFQFRLRLSSRPWFLACCVVIPLLRTLLLQRRYCKSIILERVLRQIGTSSTRSWEIRLSLI